jgi:hypothetical protein
MKKNKQLEKIKEYEINIIKPRCRDELKRNYNNEKIENYLFVELDKKYVIFYYTETSKEKNMLLCSYIDKNGENIIEDIPIKKEYKNLKNNKNIPKDDNLFVYSFSEENEIVKFIYLIYMYKFKEKRFGGIRRMLENDYISFEQSIELINFKNFIKEVKENNNETK